MNRRGRPEKDDQKTILAMAKLRTEKPSMCATAAFRQVFQSGSDEQSEEAARKRCLRKYKIHKQAMMAKAEPAEHRSVSHHLSQNSVGHILGGNKSLTESGAMERLMQQIGLVSARDAMERAMPQIGSMSAIGEIKRAMQQIGLVSARDAMQRAMPQIGAMNGRVF